MQHAAATARYSVYYGEGRDAYDVPGRVAHESIFNVNDGSYRCPGTQQGYSPFTTWTRGLAWAILGFAEELEFLGSAPARRTSSPVGGKQRDGLAPPARGAGDGGLLHREHRPRTASRTGTPARPGWSQLGAWRERPADPFNDHEPVDSSAAAIACQGLVRLGTWLRAAGEAGRRALPGCRAGRALAPARGALPAARATATRGCCFTRSITGPNGWDHVPAGRSVPCGESSMWGDYHLREAALHAQRLMGGGVPLMFWRGKDAP